MPLLRLGPSAAAKEKRLASLLGGRDISGLGLAEAVRDAQVLGSPDLAGETTTLEEVRAARDRRACRAGRGGGHSWSSGPPPGGGGAGRPPPPPLGGGGRPPARRSSSAPTDPGSRPACRRPFSSRPSPSRASSTRPRSARSKS